ncbi:hypothetical protein [Streptomyces sp. NPDC048825]|uniref:hypothetical protein n=1 Tax=Streptomyces sp. NPDC048825 TaxID=3365592 RepID=UPI003711C5AE
MGENFGMDSTGAANRHGLSRRQMLGASGVAGLAALGATGCQDDVSGPSKDAGQSQAAGTHQKAELSRNVAPGQGAVPGEDAARVSAPPPVGVLGANFNGDPGKLTFEQLEDVDATWLRGFYPMRDADGADQEEIAGSPQIGTLLTAGDRGYGTILSLKFEYKENPIPTPGSDAWRTAFERLEKVLQVVINKVDILVIGNEPFIESPDEDGNDRLNVFYEKLAQRVIAYRDENSADRTKLYMGALNHLDDEKKRTRAKRRWMLFVKDTTAIEGVDIHPHVAEPDGGEDYVHFVLDRMRPEQKFLATEFSLVNLWFDHLTDPVSAEFAAVYEEERGKQVWEVLKGATEKRFTQQKWNDFLATSPWFKSNNTYLQDQVERFRSTGRLAVATYGVIQDKAMATDFTAKKKPWLLNSLFCPYTVEDGKDGLPGRNHAWISQFRALQKT